MSDRSRRVLTIRAIAAAAAAAASCGGTSPAPQPIGNTTVTEIGAASDPDLPAGVTDGALWTCAINGYDPQPCKFHREGDTWYLTKLLGSQRFTGVATFSGAGGSAIRFVGQYFCPWGDCDAAMELAFAPAEAGGFQAEFGDEPIRLEWKPANAAEYGGAGYGGLSGRETE